MCVRDEERRREESGLGGTISTIPSYTPTGQDWDLNPKTKNDPPGQNIRGNRLMIGWFLAVPGRARFSVCLIGWLSRAQTLFSWYCVLGYTMPLIAAVQVLVTWG